MLDWRQNRISMRCPVRVRVPSLPFIEYLRAGRFSFAWPWTPSSFVAQTSWTSWPGRFEGAVGGAAGRSQSATAGGRPGFGEQRVAWMARREPCLPAGAGICRPRCSRGSLCPKGAAATAASATSREMTAFRRGDRVAKERVLACLKAEQMAGAGRRAGAASVGGFAGASARAGRDDAGLIGQHHGLYAVTQPKFG